MINRADPRNNRSAISRWAHVFERIGLALAGGSCGLFVAADVARVDVGLLSSPLIVLAIMLYGAAGFYLGIDLPPAPPDHRLPLPLTRNLGSRADAVELLSAAGTFVAAVAAVASVSGIVLDEAARTSTARAIIIGWAIGSTMQIAAGIMARTRAEPSTTS
jgi:heme A synthase